jgi:hypothetical protein
VGPDVYGDEYTALTIISLVELLMQIVNEAKDR